MGPEPSDPTSRSSVLFLRCPLPGIGRPHDEDAAPLCYLEADTAAGTTSAATIGLFRRVSVALWLASTRVRTSRSSRRSAAASLKVGIGAVRLAGLSWL